MDETSENQVPGKRVRGDNTLSISICIVELNNKKIYRNGQQISGCKETRGYIYGKMNGKGNSREPWSVRL